MRHISGPECRPDGVLRRHFPAPGYSFLVGAVVFGLPAAGCLVWTHARTPEQLLRAASTRWPLIGLNVTAAGAWITYLLAIQLIEPAVAFTIFSGVIPITAVAAGFAGFRDAPAIRHRLEAAGFVVFGIGIAALAVVTLSGLSGFVRGGIAVAAFGLALSALAGAFIAGIDGKEPVPPQELLYAFVVGLVVLAFPIYAVQKAVSLTSTLTIGLFAAAAPLLVFLLQLIEDRVDYAPATLFGLSVYFAGALLTAVGSVRAVPPLKPRRG